MIDCTSPTALEEGYSKALIYDGERRIRVEAGHGSVVPGLDMGVVTGRAPAQNCGMAVRGKAFVKGSE